MTAIRINLRNNAVTQYSNHPFNSMCMFQGKPIAAGDNGIFQLDTGNDDSGTEIAAWMEYPTSTLGVELNKKMRRFYVRGEMDGPLELVTITKGKAEAQKVYSIIPRNTTLLQQTIEVPATHRQTGEHWSFLLRNVLGADFSIDSIDATAIKVVRRRGL